MAVRDEFGRLARPCGSQQLLPQPASITSLNAKGMAEYPRLVPTAWMHGIQTVVDKLSGVDDSLVAIGQAWHSTLPFPAKAT